jgi:hypothetical protein
MPKVSYLISGTFHLFGEYWQKRRVITGPDYVPKRNKMLMKQDFLLWQRDCSGMQATGAGTTQPPGTNAPH